MFYLNVLIFLENEFQTIFRRLILSIIHSKHDFEKLKFVRFLN
jgi:hypothetical protein